mmetsp:Transcript_1922/g.4411  ORF Transcript_1922/g.4411 Transcript_1922/m.4411 type:complete len:197 (-) Transcript_1922:593-1183(-)
MFRPRAWFQRNAVALPTGMQAHPRVFSDVMGACHRPVCESYWKLAHNTLFSDEAQRRCGEAGGDWERALGHGVGDSSGELMTNRLRFLNVTIVQPLLLFTVLRADGLECYRLDDTADDGVRPRRWCSCGYPCQPPFFRKNFTMCKEAFTNCEYADKLFFSFLRPKPAAGMVTDGKGARRRKSSYHTLESWYKMLQN